MLLQGLHRSERAVESGLSGSRWAEQRAKVDVDLAHRRRACLSLGEVVSV